MVNNIYYIMVYNMGVLILYLFNIDDVGGQRENFASNMEIESQLSEHEETDDNDDYLEKEFDFHTNINESDLDVDPEVIIPIYC